MTHNRCHSPRGLGLPGRGATLIETLIAVTLLALAIMFVVSIVPSAALSQRRAERRTHAGQTASSRLEAERVNNSSDQTRTEISREKLHGVEFVTYLSVSPALAVDGTAHQKAKSVRVDVEWREGERNFVIFREAVILR